MGGNRKGVHGDAGWGTKAERQQHGIRANTPRQMKARKRMSQREGGRPEKPTNRKGKGLEGKKHKRCKSGRERVCKREKSVKP